MTFLAIAVTLATLYSLWKGWPKIKEVIGEAQDDGQSPLWLWPVGVLTLVFCNTVLVLLIYLAVGTAYVLLLAAWEVLA